MKQPLFFHSLLLLAMAAVTACSTADDDHNHPGVTTGEALYNLHCARCHGEDGTGKLVDRTPANILTAKGRQGIIDYITTDTGHGRKMPVFATMSHAEAEEIVSHLLTLKRRYDELPENQKKSEGLMIKP